jgi:uncharacterized repeat protein (TIGR01451 family)
MGMWGTAGAAPASAHPSPAGCRANGLDLTLAESVDSPDVLRQGDTVRFLIGIQNTNNNLGTPCDVTGASIGIALPGADGTFNPDPAAAVAVVPPADYPSMIGFKLVGTYAWVVNTNPNVENVFAEARASGTLHVTTPDHTFSNIVKDIGFQVTNPVLHIDKVGSITAGQAPQNVSYTYVVRNDSTTPVPMNKVTVSDNLCANATYVGGDAGDGLLANGEAWTYSCTKLHQAPGVYTNVAQACAYSTVPGDTTRPVCSNQAQWTVTLTAPPKSGVQGASVTKSPKRCVSVPTSLKVRARELTTVRVHVALNGKNIPQSVVKLSGVGINRTGKTGKHGVVTFRVRPKRSGRLVISSDHCVPAARVSVKPARQVVAPRLPQVTG